MNDAEVLQGDCLRVMQDIPGGSVDMVLCDLPYGTTQCAWDSVIPVDALWKEWHRVTKENAAICLFGAEPFSSLLRMSNLQEFKYDWIWDKVKGTGFLNAKKQPLRNHEIVSVFYRRQCTYNPQMTHGHIRKQTHRKGNTQGEVYGGAAENFYDSTDRYPRSIQVFSTDTQKSAVHPTQKPVALLEYLIRTYTNEGETVLDSTCGSGSTGVACVNTRRRFIGIELEEKYCSIARERIAAASEQAKMEAAQERLF